MSFTSAHKNAFFSAIFTAFPFMYCVAAPTIETATVTNGSITISGEGFGTKSSPAPILWVFGEDVRENGVATKKDSGIAIGSAVPAGLGAEDSLWARGGGVKYDYEARTPALSHSYRSENDGWLGWPYAFGGEDTPYSEKAFVSWRIKPSGDINAYKEVALVDLQGEFNQGSNQFTPGESITIAAPDGSTKQGHIVSVDKQNGRVHIEAPATTSSHFRKATITGNSSRATALVDSEIFYASSLSGKYFRSYETVGGAGTHAVMSTNRWISVQFDEAYNELRRAYEKPSGMGYGVPYVSKTTDWQLMEAFIDLSGDYGNGYISLNNQNRKWFYNLYIADSKPNYAGPTISNIGWEAAGGSDTVNVALNFGEIYFDKTPQRVVLSNSENYLEMGKDQEFQFINQWDQNKIVVEERFGGLDPNQAVYLYVFDEQNKGNETGFCVVNCGNVQRPPSSIELMVE